MTHRDKNLERVRTGTFKCWLWGHCFLGKSDWRIGAGGYLSCYCTRCGINNPNLP